MSHSRVQGHRVESVKLEGHRRVTPGFPSGPRGAGSLAQAALHLVPRGQAFPEGQSFRVAASAKHL